VSEAKEPAPHAGESHADAAEEIHMPPNSPWPLVAALGLGAALAGVVVGFFLLIPGVVLLVVGVALWVRDARKEYRGLH
jgi:hypothetical protein